MRTFLCIIARMAAVSVIALERMLVKVLEMTASTPSISLVMRVMISPWLPEVKNCWGIFSRCRNMRLRMSKVTCWEIQAFSQLSSTPIRFALKVTPRERTINRIRSGRFCPISPWSMIRPVRIAGYRFRIEEAVTQKSARASCFRAGE